MADTLTKLTKNQFIPFLDTAKDLTLKACSWKAIDLSTIFSLAMNENTEEKDYICYKDPVTEVINNKPTLPQEIALYEGNPMYDFMFQEFYDMPTGAKCKIPFLMCFGGTGKKAWRCISTITSKELSTVDSKLSFSIEMGGDIEKGTYDIQDGVPTFTATVEATV